MHCFLANSTKERARFRHSCLQIQSIKEEITEFLSKTHGVIGIKPGYASILIFMDENADLKQICEDLSTKFPVLRTEATDKASANAQAIKKLAASRKRRLKELLTAALTTLTLAITGPHKIHAWAGGIFALLATRHVWERRQRI